MASLRDRPDATPRRRPDAFVLSGGGNLGAIQVGMLKALTERDIVPDVVLGCSVGALNGAGLRPGHRPAPGCRRLERALGGASTRRRSCRRRGSPPRSSCCARARRCTTTPACGQRRDMLVGPQPQLRGPRPPVPVRGDRGRLGDGAAGSTRAPLVAGDPRLGRAAGRVPAGDDRRRALRRRRGGRQRPDRPGGGAGLPHDLSCCTSGPHGRPDVEIRRPLDGALLAYWIARNSRFARDLAEPARRSGGDRAAAGPAPRPPLRRLRLRPRARSSQGYENTADFLDGAGHGDRGPARRSALRTAGPPSAAGGSGAHPGGGAGGDRARRRDRGRRRRHRGPRP